MSDDEAVEDCPGNAALNMSEEEPVSGTSAYQPRDPALTGPRNPKLWFDERVVVSEAAPLGEHSFPFP